MSFQTIVEQNRTRAAEIEANNARLLFVSPRNGKLLARAVPFDGDEMGFVLSFVNEDGSPISNAKMCSTESLEALLKWAKKLGKPKKKRVAKKSPKKRA